MVAHSPSPEHVVPHTIPLHAYPLHDTVTSAGHLPLPSQLAGCVWTPSVQLWVRHETVGYVHVLVVTPLQVPSHIVAVASDLHAFRPTGGPDTGEHVPSLPLSLHDSHCPTQPELQQTPSAQ